MCYSVLTTFLWRKTYILKFSSDWPWKFKNKPYPKITGVLKTPTGTILRALGTQSTNRNWEFSSSVIPISHTQTHPHKWLPCTWSSRRFKVTQRFWSCSHLISMTDLTKPGLVFTGLWALLPLAGSCVLQLWDQSKSSLRLYQISKCTRRNRGTRRIISEWRHARASYTKHSNSTF